MTERLVFVLFAPVDRVITCHSMAAALCVWPNMPERARECVGQVMAADPSRVAWVELWPEA